jgi:hypothetical protein
MKRSKNQGIGAKGERMLALWLEETNFAGVGPRISSGALAL